MARNQGLVERDASRRELGAKSKGPAEAGPFQTPAKLRVLEAPVQRDANLVGRSADEVLVLEVDGHLVRNRELDTAAEGQEHRSRRVPLETASAVEQDGVAREDAETAFRAGQPEEAGAGVAADADVAFCAEQQVAAERSGSRRGRQ